VWGGGEARMDISQPYGGQLDIPLPRVERVHNSPPYMGGKVNISNIMFENLDIPSPIGGEAGYSPASLGGGGRTWISPTPFRGGG